jgi:UDP-N-acetylmuramate dehydrogenase
MKRLVNLKSFTTIGLSVPAMATIADSEAELIDAHKEGYLLGRGSNVVFTARFPSVVINRTRGVEILGDAIKVSGGVTIAELLAVCRSEKLSGLEWAAGLPASVGGAIVQNAGAYGHSVSENVLCVEVFDGKKSTIDVNGCGFAYRNSSLRDKTVLSATFKLTKADGKTVKDKIREALALRSTQPKGKTAGCVYKTGAKSAGYYIERAGLKGAREGGIFVSPVHAGFFVNDGSGTPEEFVRLCHRCERAVFEKFGVKLEKEIQIIGD